jgi:hypothetical protein
MSLVNRAPNLNQGRIARFAATMSTKTEFNASVETLTNHFSGFALPQAKEAILDDDNHR